MGIFCQTLDSVLQQQTPHPATLDPDMPAQQLRLVMGEITAQEERTARATIRWANSCRAPQAVGGGEEVVQRLRADGWMVAVHNDYRLNGVPYTFWLFTKGERCIKGEGRTDAEALAQVAALATPSPQLPAAEQPAMRDAGNELIQAVRLVRLADGDFLQDRLSVEDIELVVRSALSITKHSTLSARAGGGDPVGGGS